MKYFFAGKWEDQHTPPDPKRCNTCSCVIGTEDCLPQSLKNRRWLATLDENRNVAQECCEQCAQELSEAGE